MDIKQIFNELRQLPCSEEICPQCLIQVPGETKKGIGTYNSPQFIRESMSDLTKVVNCVGCQKVFHWICARDKQNFVCADCAHIMDSEIRCLVCDNALGYCEVFYFNGEVHRAHFLCIYFSKNFLLKTIRTLEFIPLEIPMLCSERNLCQICYKPIHESCSVFRCHCEWTTHIYCSIYITANFQQIPSLAEMDLDLLYLPVWLLERSSQLPYHPSIPRPPALMQLTDKREELIDSLSPPNDALFVFNMYCPQHRSGKTSFCICHEDAKPHYMQCDYCQSWFHVNDCAATRILDSTSLDVMKLPESLREISTSKLFSVSAKYAKHGFDLRRGRLEDMEFMCKMCQHTSFYTFSHNNGGALTHKSVTVFMWLLLRHEENEAQGLHNFELPQALYLKQEAKKWRSQIAEKAAFSTPSRSTNKTPNINIKSKQRSPRGLISSTSNKALAVSHQLQRESPQTHEVALPSSNLACSIDEFEESLITFLADPCLNLTASHSSEFFYDRLSQLHNLCQQTVKDQCSASPSSFSFYAQLLQAILDFIDSSKGFSIRRVQKKLRRSYANASTPRAKRILASFANFLNQNFLRDLLEFITVIRPYLHNQYIIVNETFALLENDAIGAFNYLIKARITSPEVLDIFNQKARSHFAKQVKQRITSDEKMFFNLLPVHNYKEAVNKLKTILDCFFLTSEQATQAINFFHVLYELSCEKKMQLRLCKRLDLEKSIAFVDLIRQVDTPTLTIEELQKAREKDTALFFPSDQVDAALSSFDANRAQVDLLVEEFNKELNPKLIFKAAKLLYRAGTVPSQELRNLISLHAPLAEIRAYLKDRTSSMTVDRFNFLLSIIDCKKLKAELLTKAQIIFCRVAEISLLVEGFYNSLYRNDSSSRVVLKNGTPADYSFSPQGAERILALRQELKALRLEMPPLEALHLNFILAHEFNNAILSVYSLDCEEEYQFSEFELVPQSATFEILDRISRLHIDRYVLPMLENVHVAAKESYVARMLKEKYLPVSFLNRVTQLCSQNLKSELLTQRLCQLSLLKDKIRAFFHSTLNVYDPHLLSISHKADEILNLAIDFVIDEPLLMDQLRKIRVVKLNVFLITNMHNFIDCVEKAMKGTCSPPKTCDYSVIWKIIAGRSDFPRCPQLEKLVFEFLNAYGKTQASEADYWCIQHQTGLDLDHVYEIQARLEAFPLLSLEANPLIYSRVEEHHKLCREFIEEVELMKRNGVIELFSIRDNIEKIYEGARNAPILSDTLKCILKPVELLNTICRSTLITLSSLRVISNRLEEQLGSCVLSEDMRMHIEKLEAATGIWKELKKGIDKENIPQLEFLQCSLFTPFRVEFMGKTVNEIHLQVDACIKALQEDFRSYIDLRNWEIPFKGKAADKYKALIEKIEYVNSHAMLNNHLEKKLNIFFYTKNLTGGSCGKYSRSVCLAYKEIAEKRANFEEDMKHLATTLLEACNNLALKVLVTWPHLEEFGPGAELSMPPSFLPYERFFYKLFIFLYDAFSFLCALKSSSDKKVPLRYLSYVKKKFIEKKNKSLPSGNYFVFSIVFCLFPREIMADYNFLASSLDIGSLSEEELLKKLPESITKLSNYWNFRCLKEKEKIESELEQAIQKHQKHWIHARQLFDVDQFAPQEEKLLALCQSIDILILPTPPVEKALQSLWDMSDDERKRLQSKIFNYSVTLKENSDEREYIIKYNMDINVLLRRANEIHARDNLINRLDISKEPVFKSPLRAQKRVKKTTLAAISRSALLLQEVLFPTKMQIKIVENKCAYIYSTVALPDDDIRDNLIFTLKEETDFTVIRDTWEKYRATKELLYGCVDPTFFLEAKTHKIFQAFQKLVNNGQEWGLATMFGNFPSDLRMHFTSLNIDCGTVDMNNFVCTLVYNRSI